MRDSTVKRLGQHLNVDGPHTFPRSPARRVAKACRAARRLAQMGTPAAVEWLAGAIDAGYHEQVVAIAWEALADLRDQGCINAVCKRWNQYWPASPLDDLVVERGWIATYPADPPAGPTTALHVGRPEVLVDDGAATARALLAIADHDPYPELRERARAALGTLRGADAREVVCAAAIDGVEAALHAAVAGDFAARDPGRKAVLLFLAGRHEEYAELDFDGALLRAAHRAADGSLRERLAAAARTSGRLEWVRAIGVESSADRLAALSDDEWATARALLAGGRQWERMWRLALDAPPVRAAELLRDLASGGWLPDDPADRADCAELLAAARECARCPVTRVLVASPEEAIRGLAITPDGKELITAYQYGEIVRWTLPDGEPAGRFADPAFGPAIDLAVTPDGRLLVDGYGSGLWQLPSGKRLDPRTRGWDRLAVAPGGRLGARSRIGEGTELFGVPSCERVRDLGTGWCNDLVFSRDGKLLVGTQHGAVRLWRVPSGECLNEIQVHHDPFGSPPVMAVTRDSRLLVTSGRDNEVRLWRLPSGEPAATLSGHADDVCRLAITPDDKLLVSWDISGRVRLWRLPSGEPAGAMESHGRTGRDFMMTPDGQQLVTIGDDRTLRLWDLPSGEPVAAVRDVDRPQNVAMAPDGALLAVVDKDGSLRLWLPRIFEAAHTPTREITPAQVDLLRARYGHTEAERPWLDLISVLVRRRHRYDIEVVTATSGRPEPTDVELDGG